MGILSLILALLGLMFGGFSVGGGGSGSDSFIIEPPAVQGETSTLGEEVIGVTDFGDAPAPYGIASHSSQDYDWLGSGVSQESSYGGSGWVDTFDDGVSWSPFNLIPGQTASINFIVSAYNPSAVAASWHQYVRIWIDWDQSESWDADENIFPPPDYRWHRYIDDLASGGLLQEEITQGFLVPSDAMIGNTWLRARSSRYYGMSPIGNYTQGEAEDYPINVVPEPATMLLFGVSFSGLWLFGKMRKK